MGNKSIMQKILLVVVILMLVQYLILFFKDTISFNKNIQNTIEKMLNLKYGSFIDSINSYKDKGDFYLDGLLSNEELIKLLKEKNREGVLKLLKDDFTEMKKNGKIEQFQFHEIPAVSFLRLHKPEKFGDDLASFRKTVVKANTEKVEVSGIEIGVGDVGVRIVRPVYDESKNHIGSVEYGGNLDTKFIEKFVEQSSDEVKKDGMDITIVSKNLKGEYMLVGSNFEKELEKEADKISKEVSEKERIIKISGNEVISYNVLRDFSKEPIGYIKLKFNISKLLKEKNDFFIYSIIIYLIITIVMVFIIIFILKISIISSVKKISDDTHDLSRGDLTVRFEDKKEDEIGKMSKNLNQFLDMLSTIVSEILNYSVRVASGTEQMGSTMEQISSSVEDLGDSATTTAAAIEEMASTTATVSQNIETLLKSSEETLRLANNGGNAVKITIKEINEIQKVVEVGTKNVKDLGNKTNEIGEIVTVINDIASQTNLLALNAAIEAARAGDAGRGFEVVAEEVRKLAEKTTLSTKEISRMVKEIQGETNGVIVKMEEVNAKVEEGVKTAKNTGKSLDDIVYQTENLRDMVNLIANSTKEQSVAVDEIAKQTENVTKNVVNNGSAIEESTVAIKEIADIAEKLNQIVKQFKIESIEEERGVKARRKGEI